MKGCPEGVGFYGTLWGGAKGVLPRSPVTLGVSPTTSVSTVQVGTPR